MIQILQGDCLDILKTLPDESVNCCVTSPPYWGLRDYGCDGQLGLERTPELYVAKMVEVFREVRRVLRNDGVLWLNLGDTYFGSGQGWGDTKTTNKNHPGSRERKKPEWVDCGLKSKDLVGVPWMVAFALRLDGWYLRSDIIWSKPNPMPESVTDRPTKAHEYIFLMSKSAKYYYDADSIREPWTCDRDDMREKGVRTGLAYLQQGHAPSNSVANVKKQDGVGKRTYSGFNGRWDASEENGTSPEGRNRRTVWEVTTKPFSEAHFATFPPDLIEPCIKAGCPEGGTVLDCFSGAGTTGLVSSRFNRNYIGIELNPAYVEMSKKRIEQDAPMFNRIEPQGSVVPTQESFLK